MGHNHHHSTRYNRAFTIGIVLNLIFIGIEFTLGQWARSLALIADAGHNLSDVFGLAVAWLGMMLSQKRPTASRTYGLRKSSILAALANAMLLLTAVGAIAWEAVRRFASPIPSDGATVMKVAAVGIVVNGVTAWLFISGRGKDLNIRGAFQHMVADALVSFGVVISGAAMWVTGKPWIDPVVSLAVAATIAVGTWRLLCDSVNLALDGVPEDISLPEVRRYFLGLPTCREVHDLHIWGLSTTETALTVHLVMDRDACSDALLKQVAMELHDRFGIEHSTLQIESGDGDFTCRCGVGLRDQPQSAVEPPLTS